MGTKVVITNGTNTHTYWIASGALPQLGNKIAFDGFAGIVTDVTWVHVNEVTFTIG